MENARCVNHFEILLEEAQKPSYETGCCRCDVKSPPQVLIVCAHQELLLFQVGAEEKDGSSDYNTLAIGGVIVSFGRTKGPASRTHRTKRFVVVGLH